MFEFLVAAVPLASAWWLCRFRKYQGVADGARTMW